MAYNQPTFTDEELQTEEWRPIPDYEALYSASNLGRLRADTRQKGSIYPAGHILKPSASPRRQYLQVTLAGTKPRKTYFVHVLIARTFIGPRPEGQEVNHKDTIQTNNRALNLEYLTHAEHEAHAALHSQKAYGEKSNRATLKAADIPIIRAMTDIPPQEMAIRFGVTVATIGKVRRRERWKHIVP